MRSFFTKNSGSEGTLSFRAMRRLSFRDRFIGLLCVTIGSIFIAISLALLFNTVFSSSWAGYGVIGVFILALGVIINSRQ